MPSTRKRTRRDVEPDSPAPAPEPPKEVPLLHRVRNTWQFANLFQWIYLFGKVVKIDESIDVDVRCPISTATPALMVPFCLLTSHLCDLTGA